MIGRIFGNKQGQIHFVTLILIFLIVGIIFVAADEILWEENNIQIDLCENVFCQSSQIVCPDGATVECSNSCNPENGECTSCTPSCTGHEQPIGTLADNTGESSTEGNDPVSQSIENISKESPSLKIEISHDSKISRLQEIEIQAIVTNEGNGKAKNVILNWVLPEGFEIVSNDKTEDCGDVGKNEFCISTIKVQPSLSTPLGINEINVEVAYSE